MKSKAPSLPPLTIFWIVSSVRDSSYFLPSDRSSAGGSCLSSLCGKAAVGASTLLSSVSPQQLGEGDVLDEDVAREAERVGQGGGDGDAVKVIA